jgi:uroporphyrinogen decarboxylase
MAGRNGTKHEGCPVSGCNEGYGMNSLDRIKAAIGFEASDRVPVIAQVFGHTAILAERNIRDYVQSGEVLAECQLRALERYGYDAVFGVTDTNVETEALGSEIVYRIEDYPYVRSHAFSKATNLETVAVPNPRRAGRMAEILRALKILRGELADEVLVVGCILGPMTLATQLCGMENALYFAVDDPEGFERLLDFSVRVVVEYGKAQIEAGAHLPMVFDPSASQAVVPPMFFKELLLPRIKKVFTALQAAGAIAGWLHVAGPITPVLPLFAQTGANIVNFDYCVDPTDVLSLLRSTCCNGNIKPLDFVEAGPEQIVSDSMRLVEMFSDRGGFILSSGCEIPPGAKAENIEALVSAVRGRR